MDGHSHPKCVAETEQLPDDSLLTSNTLRHRDNYFRSAQWTADGTSIITNSADHNIRTFVAPQDLLEENDGRHKLSPYSTISSFEPVNAVACYPYFDLQDQSTALILSSVREHPIRLHSALSSTLLASYPLVNPMTEVMIAPHSLLFVDGNHFIAGSDSLISKFDISRPGQEPVLSSETGPKNRKSDLFNPSMSMRGIVSTLAIDQTANILAAGTFGRDVGLYDSAGQGECIGVFNVKGTEADRNIHGNGISKLAWSPCGRYLYIAERKSDGIILYDIRKTGQLLAWLEDRKADTNQRLDFDVFPTDDQGGHEIWAGGTDGFVRVWKSPHLEVGSVTPTFEWEAHDDSVSSAILHRTGSVIATTSGQRHFYEDIESQATQHASSIDNSLKIWAI